MPERAAAHDGGRDADVTVRAPCGDAPAMSSNGVLLVSLDGVAPRCVSPERMPHLCGLVRAGAGCFTARTVDPPWTRPVHASMLRGVDPTTHGLIDNSMAPLATDAPSILAVARGAGHTTASINNWRQMDSLIEPDASRHRISIDAGYDPDEDELMVDLAEQVYARTTPQVTFVYLCRADLAGHEHGWDSPAYLESLAVLDATFGRLLAAVGDDVDVVVTTDHGGVERNHGDAVDDVMEIFVATRSPRIAPGSMWTAASMLDVAPTVADLAGLAPDPRWQGRSLVGQERPMVDHLLGLLQECDQFSYGENVSMLAHALQSAAEVEAQAGPGVDEPLIVAALLHDVGHLTDAAGDYGDPDHAESGARFLRPWLPAAVTEPIRLHVAAKRHLVGSDPSYAANLSEASRITLEQQGGPLTAAESAAFLAEPHAERAVRLRHCDDQGKRPGVRGAPLEHHRERLARALAGDTGRAPGGG